MPFGSGYSVEAQVEGGDDAGGIQFEITPYPPLPRPEQLDLFVRCLTGRRIKLRVEDNLSIPELKRLIERETGEGVVDQRLILAGRQAQDHLTLKNYGVLDGDSCQMVVRLRGAGEASDSRDYNKAMAEMYRNLPKPKPPQHQMTLAPGGKIAQSIVADTLDSTKWQSTRTVVFNAQILNSAAYKAVTGKGPPTLPMTAEDYAKHGLPFFKLYEEPSTVHGNFDQVLSVAQMDEQEEEKVEPMTIAIGKKEEGVGLVNPEGPKLPFRTARDLSEEVERVHVVDF